MGEVHIKEGVKIPQKKVKKKHYGWRFCLTFLGGMVFSILAIGGTAAVFGTVTPAKNVVSMFGGNPDELLGIDYQDDSILQLVMKLSSKKFETLGDINDVTPIVKKTIDETINPLLEEQIHYEFIWDELKIKPFSISNSGRPVDEVDPNETLGDYIGRAIKEGVSLASFMGDVNQINNVLKLFLFPTTNEPDQPLSFDLEHPYSLSDFINGDSSFFNNIIDKIRVGDVISTEGDAFLSQLQYWKISDFTSEKLMTLKLGPLFTQEQINSNILLKTISEKNWTLADISDSNNLKTLKVSELLDMANASSIVLAISNYTLNDLMTKDLATMLKVSDVYPNATSGIMYTLRDSIISDLSKPETFMSLKVGDILTNLQQSDMLYSFKDKTLTELQSTSLNDIKIKDVFSQNEINDNPILKALVQKDPEITLGSLSNYETISSLKISDLLSSSDIENNFVLKALALKNTTVGSLSNDINALKLGEVIDISDEPTTSIKYKIVTALGEYPFCSVADHFDELLLNQIFDINSSSPIVLQALASTSLSDLPNALDNLTFGQVLDIAPGSAFDKDAIKNASISDAAAFEEILKANLTLGDLVDIDASSPGILSFLKDTTLNNISNKISTMTLGDILTIDASSPQILKSLSTVLLFGSSNNLESALSNLKFNQVYTADDCSDGIMKILWDNSSGGDFLISDLSNQIKLLRLIDILADTIYEDPNASKKKVTKTWWFLLTEEGETFAEEEKYYVLKNGANYTLDDMNHIVTNMEYHMKNESLFSLIDANFITIDATKAYKLELPFPQDPTRKIGDLTISEFANFCLSLM